MPFDINTAREEKPKFDIKTARDAESQTPFIAKTEGFLSRALKGATKEYLPQDTSRQQTNPFLTALDTAKRAVEPPGWRAMESVKNEALEGIENPVGRFALDVATSPESLGGIGVGKAAVKGGAGAMKKVFPYTSKESRVTFTKGVEKSLKSRRTALTRGYGAALDKSYASVDLGDIEKGLGLPEIKGTHSLREAQELKNSLTTMIPEAIKNGTKISPKYLNEKEVAAEITRRMIKAEPKLAPVIEKYGKHAENFKKAISPIKSSRGSENIFGSNLIKQMFGSGGNISEGAQVAMQEFAPKVAKKVKGAKINENIFRALRGGTITAAASNFIPGFLKRALLSEATK